MIQTTNSAISFTLSSITTHNILFIATLAYRTRRRPLPRTDVHLASLLRPLPGLEIAQFYKFNSLPGAVQFPSKNAPLPTPQAVRYLCPVCSLPRPILAAAFGYKGARARRDAWDFQGRRRGGHGEIQRLAAFQQGVSARTACVPFRVDICQLIWRASRCDASDAFFSIRT